MANRQLAFELPHRPALTRSDFVAARANVLALDWVERWPDWPATVVTLFGPAGAGKTHLAQIWRTRADALQLPPEALAEAAPPDLLAGARAVLIDEAERAAERPLLHLHNMLAERGGHLLLTAREAPSRWDIALADLRSRLVAAPAIGVAAPDEELVATLLVKLFADRHLAVPTELVSFLVLRLERSFAAAQEAVARLDRAALAERRPVTIPLARQVLFGETDDAP